MEKPDIVFCCDDHFCRAIYGLGPYIADYSEQCLLACIVQGWCPKLVQLDCSEFGITTHIVLLDVLPQLWIWIVRGIHRGVSTFFATRITQIHC